MTRQRYSNSYQEQAIEKPTITPHELVSGVVRLVSLPEVCIRVNEMLDDPKISASDIGKIISQDPGLTARLLKIVNSAFYGFPSRIETVSRAVTVIGLRELRGLVLAASAVEFMNTCLSICCEFHYDSLIFILISACEPYHKSLMRRRSVERLIPSRRQATL